MNSHQKSKVQQNDYPGWPNSPNAEAKKEMFRLLDELCTSASPDTDRIAKVWLLLRREDAPKSFTPGPRGRRKVK